MTEPEVEATAMTDPATGQPLSPAATKTYADWIAVDPALGGEAETAFRNAYGPAADQLMDKATLDARIASLVPVDAPPPPDPEADPSTSDGAGE